MLGLCYVAYLLGIGYSVNRDARGEVEKWIGYVKGTEEDQLLAFHRTLPPGMRQNVTATDKYQMERQFRDELLMFRNCDLVQLAQRNKGEFNYTTGAVEWASKPGAVECSVIGTAKCPEGTFPVLMQLKGLEGVTGEGGGGGRQWMITRPQGGGFIDQRGATRTAYGWLVASLEMDGGAFGRGFVSHLAPGPTSHTYAYRAFVVPGGDRRGWGAVATDPIAQFVFAVPSRALGDEGYADYMANHFYKQPGGADPAATRKRSSSPPGTPRACDPRARN